MRNGSLDIVAAGTSKARIAMWKNVALANQNQRPESVCEWKLQTPTEVEGNVTQLQVGKPSVEGDVKMSTDMFCVRLTSGLPFSGALA